MQSTALADRLTEQFERDLEPSAAIEPGRWERPATHRTRKRAMRLLRRER